MDKVKTLSAAMRLGSSFTQPCIGALRDNSNGTCALGAIMVATGTALTNSTKLLVDRLKERWPELESMRQCPACGGTCNLKTVIVHLNDNHKWTREAIADWLEANGL